MWKKFFSFVVIFSIALVFSSCSKSSEGVLVSVNGDEITQEEIDMIAKINPAIKFQLANPMARQRILDTLVAQALFYNEALKEGLNRKKEVKDSIALYKKAAVAQAYLDDRLEKAAEKYYKDHPDEFNTIGIAHIMISYAPSAAQKDTAKKDNKAKEAKKSRSEGDALKIANEVKDLLDKGEKFSDVAAKYSDDESTKNRGGEMGAVSKNDKGMETRGYAPLMEKAFEMKVGEVSGPIKTNKGYHIITLTKGLEQEDFKNVLSGIIQKIGMEVKDKLLADLKSKSKIEYPGEKKADEKPQVKEEAKEPKPEAKAEKPAEEPKTK